MLGRRLAGRGLICLGEVGIGNTTVAAALSCALLGLGPTTAAGLGAGADTAMVRTQGEVVGRAARAGPRDAWRRGSATRGCCWRASAARRSPCWPGSPSAPPSAAFPSCSTASSRRSRRCSRYGRSRPCRARWWPASCSRERAHHAAILDRARTRAAAAAPAAVRRGRRRLPRGATAAHCAARTAGDRPRQRAVGRP